MKKMWKVILMILGGVALGAVLLYVVLTGLAQQGQEQIETEPTQTQTDPAQTQGLTITGTLAGEQSGMLAIQTEDAIAGILIGEDTEVEYDWSQAEAAPDKPDTVTAYGCTSIMGPAFEPLPEGMTDVWNDVTAWYAAERVTIVMAALEAPEKPVIYLYPPQQTEVHVELDYDGILTCTYPAYRDGWTVLASPDGTLTDETGQTYNYLYWEGKGNADYDFSTGFCVAGEDTAAFLEQILADLGLTRKEANEFIVYWLPRMQDNAYNLISFQTDAYTSRARLHVTPEPDTLIRVFMAWKPLDEAVEIAQQNFQTPTRTGFTVVEWGGAEVK